MFLINNITLFAVAKMKRTELSCLIVAVMTHGDSVGRVWANDKKYFVNNLWDTLKPVKCRQLIGIPKIFLIQVNKMNY